MSSLTNRPVLRPYLFRNYDYLPGTPSCYPGSYTYKLWEALRAATAAPGYFSECVLEGNVFSVSSTRSYVCVYVQFLIH